MVFLGAESASAETLARMDKGGTLTPEMTLELVRVMRGHGVVPELSFVLGNPPDPAADVVGVANVTCALPRLLGGAGVIDTFPLPLSGEETELLRQSAGVIRGALDELERG